MNKKILVIVSLAVVIAAGAGVFAASSGNSIFRIKNNDIASVGAEGDPTLADEESSDDIVPDVTPDDHDEESVIETEEVPDEPASEVEDQVKDGPDYTDEVVSNRFSVMRTVDNSTGDDYSPRVVLGSGYSACYVEFDNTGHFELLLDPATGTVKTGNYALYDDIISVEYDDGSGSEYSIIANSDGGIDYIIVNYGDYAVYFG